jgi:HEPN domain-containing protein
MQPNAATLRLVRSWIQKARHDLLAAEELSRTPELWDTAVYHCQQAAEKALKGYLAWCGIVPRRTHDLRELARQCESREPAFSGIMASAAALAPYAVQFRYPGAADEPTQTEMNDALQHGDTVLTFTIRQFPTGTIA